jgi:DNA repair protein RadA/Sms
VSILSAEDDPEDILVPRLRAGGAKLELVRILPAALKTSNGMQPITFPAHVSLLDESIRTDGTVALFIDPLTAFLSERVDSHNDASARRVLAELAALAQRTHCAIISIRHLNKLGGIDRALYRAGGSIAFVAAARTSFLLAFDPGDKMPESERRRVLACIKSNIGPKPQSRAFRLVAEAGEVTHVEWLSEASLLSADDLLRRPRERKPEALQEAITFLENSLADGARPSTEIEGRAHKLGISEATLRRAKRILGVQSRKKGFAGIWHLEITTKETAN